MAFEGTLKTEETTIPSLIGTDAFPIATEEATEDADIPAAEIPDMEAPAAEVGTPAVENPEDFECGN